MNKWVFSLVATFSVFLIIFINLNDNSQSSIRTNTELDNVTNGVDFVTYSCSESLYKGKVGFVISEGIGHFKHFLID